jgi:hypothetical protein
MLVTSFQGFQTKPVTAQALFQCTQDHEEYLQAYVRRFLRLRAQAPTVPNEIVIEAMIKGLRPGSTAQYFARKPPQTLEKLLQNMDEYIRAANDFRQRREEAYRFSEMTRGFGGRIHPSMLGQFTTPLRVMTEEVNCRGRSTLHKLRGSNKVLSGRQLQEAEAPGASKEDMGTSPGRSTAYFVVKTRATIQERAKSPSKSKKRLQKPKPGKVNQSRSCTLLRVTHPTYQNMWVIILQLLLLRLVSHKFLGHSFHLRHHHNLPIYEVSSQKGANRPISSEISGRDPKLAQLTVLSQNQNTSIDKYPTFGTVLHSLSFSF